MPGYCCFSDGEALLSFPPDSAPCLPVTPGAPAAVLLSGLDTCFCVAVLGVTRVPAAGPEVSPWAGPAAIAAGPQTNNIDMIPADKPTLTTIVLIRCLPRSLKKRVLRGGGCCRLKLMAQPEIAALPKGRPGLLCTTSRGCACVVTIPHGHDNSSLPRILGGASYVPLAEGLERAVGSRRLATREISDNLWPAFATPRMLVRSGPALPYRLRKA
jgi:hypothetical protein